MPEVMTPEDVPQELVSAAIAALMTAPDINDTPAVIRVVLAAALPLQAQRTRAQAAEDIKRNAAIQCPGEDGFWQTWMEAAEIARTGKGSWPWEQ